MILKSIDNAAAKSLEKLPIEIVSSGNEACLKVAISIAKLIRLRAKNNAHVTLGLATGSTPIGVYKELVRMHQQEGLSFKNVITFNLDEYFPMKKASLFSYHHFMHQHLFNHIDILPNNIHIPDGSIELNQIADFCKLYENKIDNAGGLDIQILGIGRTGHVGFNEPPSHQNSITRLVKLDPITISDATREFVHEEDVPRRAITMGIKTILKAKKIYLLAWGEKKAEIIQKTCEGPITEDIPATFLQEHTNVETLIDESASLELTRVKTPWLVTLCNWDEPLTKKAIIWLSQKAKKPILKLTEEDYKLHDLGDLLVFQGDAQELNIKIFNTLQNTITGWPGGKPRSDDKNRPERSLPEKKRVLVFSPHPDDDVISMGGTFIRLADQGHDVHVAYQTSGNIAVFDDDALRYFDFANDLMMELGIDAEILKDTKDKIVKSLQGKSTGEPDIQIVRDIKRLIRKHEAAAGARFSGIKADHIHFLNLPFYETGGVEKQKISTKDIAIAKELIKNVRPHQIFAAGDLRDPHGTHKVCLDVIFQALKELKHEHPEAIEDCYLWLYRGAWQEWAIDEIEMAIPLSPLDLEKKRKAIFKHQSQKDTPVYPGSDKREFWQRAEERNRLTAKLYDELGLTEYEAMEAFVRYHF